MNLKKIIREEIDDIKWVVSRYWNLNESESDEMEWIKDVKIQGTVLEWLKPEMKSFLKPNTDISISGDIALQRPVTSEFIINLNDHPFLFKCWAEYHGKCGKDGTYMKVINKAPTKWLNSDVEVLTEVTLGIFLEDNDLIIKIV